MPAPDRSTSFDACKRLAESGRTPEAIAEDVGATPQHVRNLIRFYRAVPENVRKAWQEDKDGRFTFVHLAKFASQRIPQGEKDANLQKLLADPAPRPRIVWSGGRAGLPGQKGEMRNTGFTLEVRRLALADRIASELQVSRNAVVDAAISLLEDLVPASDEPQAVVQRQAGLALLRERLQGRGAAGRPAVRAEERGRRGRDSNP